MAQLPQPFPPTPSPAIASYDWSDITTATGYIRYFCCTATEDGPAYSRYLTTKSLDAQPPEAELANTVSIDYDFDIEFKRTATIEGECFINFTQYAGASSTQDTTVTIYHYDGSTETSLGTVDLPQHTSVTPIRENIKITLSQKNFAVGDILRVNVTSDHVGGNTGKIYFDPATKLTVTDADSRTVGTDFLVDVPFKLDL